MLDRHSSIDQRKARPPERGVQTNGATGRRVLLAWIFGALAPGIVFVTLEMALANDSRGDGQIATIFVFYLVGFLSFAALRLIFDPITVLILALVAFVMGLPFGVAVSLGIFAVAPVLFAIGGIVATLAFGLRRKSPAILA